MPDWKSLWQNLEHIVLKGTWTYYRPVTEECEGSGSVTYPNGNVYTGEYWMDKPHGQGKLSYYDGSSYEGEFEMGFFTEKGKYTKPDGTVYEGQWLNGKPHGEGKATFADQSTYEGTFEEGLPEGNGTLLDYGPMQRETEKVMKAYDPWDSNGVEPELHLVPYRYTGEWRHGLEHGHGEDRQPDGSTYQGVYAEGKRCAKGSYFSADGQSTYEGSWVNGRRHGPGKEKLADGTSFEGTFIKDRRGQGFLIEDKKEEAS